MKNMFMHIHRIVFIKENLWKIRLPHTKEKTTFNYFLIFCEVISNCRLWSDQAVNWLAFFNIMCAQLKCWFCKRIDAYVTYSTSIANLLQPCGTQIHNHMCTTRELLIIWEAHPSARWATGSKSKRARQE